jgi:hypothetical protein
MSSLDRAAVARIANLARIEVPEADQDRLAAELSGILGWIEQLGEVDTATSSRCAPSCRSRSAGARTRSRTAAGRRGPGQRALRPRRLLRRAEGGRVAPMADLTRLTLEAARDGLRRKEFSARELRRRTSPPSRARARSTPSSPRRPSRRCAWRRPRTSGSPAARAAFWKGCRSRSRTCSAPRACSPRRARASSTASSRPTSRRSRASSGRPAPSASARRTSTSSPWARRT